VFYKGLTASSYCLRPAAAAAAAAATAPLCNGVYNLTPSFSSLNVARLNWKKGGERERNPFFFSSPS